MERVPRKARGETDQEIGQKSEERIEDARTSVIEEDERIEGDEMIEGVGVMKKDILLSLVTLEMIDMAKKLRSITSMKTTPTDGIKFMRPTRSLMP